MSTATVNTHYNPAFGNGQFVPQQKYIDVPTFTEPPVITRPARPWGSGLFSVSDIRAWLAAQSVDFRAGMINILRIKGIDTRQELIFQFNSFGNAILVSDHADKSRIEDSINRDRDLRHKFMVIASTARFLDTVSARPDFEERYRLNPEKAMAEYLPLAASLTRPTFNLQVSRAGLTTYFTPLP